jgi:hypothetical protein
MDTIWNRVMVGAISLYTTVYRSEENQRMNSNSPYRDVYAIPNLSYLRNVEDEIR